MKVITITIKNEIGAVLSEVIIGVKHNNIMLTLVEYLKDEGIILEQGDTIELS